MANPSRAAPTTRRAHHFQTCGWVARIATASSAGAPTVEPSNCSSTAYWDLTFSSTPSQPASLVRVAGQARLHEGRWQPGLHGRRVGADGDGRRLLAPSRFEGGLQPLEQADRAEVVDRGHGAARARARTRQPSEGDDAV